MAVIPWWLLHRLSLWTLQRRKRPDAWNKTPELLLINQVSSDNYLRTMEASSVCCESWFVKWSTWARPEWNRWSTHTLDFWQTFHCSLDNNTTWSISLLHVTQTKGRSTAKAKLSRSTTPKTHCQPKLQSTSHGPQNTHQSMWNLNSLSPSHIWPYIDVQSRLDVKQTLKWLTMVSKESLFADESSLFILLFSFVEKKGERIR